MSFSDIHNVGATVKVVTGVSPVASAAATINGVAVDRRDFGSAVLTHFAGAATGAPTAQTAATKLQESDTSGGTFTDVTGAAPSDLTVDDTDSSVDVDLTGVKRFVRVVTTVSFTGGTSPTLPVGAALVLGGSVDAPV